MPTDAERIVATNGQFLCKFSVGGCDRYGQEVCTKCNEPFCPDHASEIDPTFCKTCLTPQHIETTKEPLVDDDGVAHNGAVITPIGAAFKTLAQRIFEMSDETLKLHIEAVKVQVKQAETVLDYRRIDLASSEVELEQRQLMERKKLRGVKMSEGKIKVIASGGVTKDAPKKTQSAADFLAGLLKSQGVPVTAENIAKLAQSLGALGKKAQP